MHQSKLLIGFIFSVALSLNALADIVPGAIYINGLAKLGYTGNTVTLNCAKLCYGFDPNNCEQTQTNLSYTSLPYNPQTQQYAFDLQTFFGSLSLNTPLWLVNCSIQNGSATNLIYGEININQISTYTMDPSSSAAVFGAQVAPVAAAPNSFAYTTNSTAGSACYNGVYCQYNNITSQQIPSGRISFTGLPTTNPPSLQLTCLQGAQGSTNTVTATASATQAGELDFDLYTLYNTLKPLNSFLGQCSISILDGGLPAQKLVDNFNIAPLGTVCNNTWCSGLSGAMVLTDSDNYSIEGPTKSGNSSGGAYQFTAFELTPIVKGSVEIVGMPSQYTQVKLNCSRSGQAPVSVSTAVTGGVAAFDLKPLHDAQVSDPNTPASFDQCTLNNAADGSLLGYLNGISLLSTANTSRNCVGNWCALLQSTGNAPVADNALSALVSSCETPPAGQPFTLPCGTWSTHFLPEAPGTLTVQVPSDWPSQNWSLQCDGTNVFAANSQNQFDFKTLHLAVGGSSDSDFDPLNLSDCNLSSDYDGSIASFNINQLAVGNCLGENSPAWCAKVSNFVAQGGYHVELQPGIGNNTNQWTVVISDQAGQTKAAVRRAGE